MGEDEEPNVLCVLHKKPPTKGRLYVSVGMWQQKTNKTDNNEIRTIKSYVRNESLNNVEATISEVAPNCALETHSARVRKPPQHITYNKTIRESISHTLTDILSHTHNPRHRMTFNKITHHQTIEEIS